MSLQISIREKLNILDIKKINLIHIFITGLLLVYIGYKKKDTEKLAYYLLGLMTILIVFLVPFPSSILNLSYWSMIHWTHYLIILPAFAYITYLGLYNKPMTNELYDGLLGTGLVVIVYHLYKYSK